MCLDSQMCLVLTAAVIVVNGSELPNNNFTLNVWMSKYYSWDTSQKPHGKLSNIRNMIIQLNPNNKVIPCVLGIVIG